MRSTRLVVLCRGQFNWQWNLLGALNELIDTDLGYRNKKSARTAGREALRAYKRKRKISK